MWLTLRCCSRTNAYLGLKQETLQVFYATLSLNLRKGFSMNVILSTHKPADELQPFIHSYWFGTFNTNNQKDYEQSVVPNGCIELIIHLSESHCYLGKNNAWASSPDFTVLGLYTKPYEVKFAEAVNVMGIRFYPDGVRQLFGISPAEFSATYEDGADVFGKGLTAFCKYLCEYQDRDEIIKFVNSYFRKQLATHYSEFDYTHRAMQLIRSASGSANYSEVINEVPISNRQLQREFKKQYGITMSEYLRISRISAIHEYMLSQPKYNQLPHDLNFTDQSHMIREFRNYTGVTPGQFRKKRSAFIISR